jgi:hypothetical protein
MHSHIGAIEPLVKFIVLIINRSKISRGSKLQSAVQRSSSLLQPGLLSEIHAAANGEVSPTLPSEVKKALTGKRYHAKPVGRVRSVWKMGSKSKMITWGLIVADRLGARAWQTFR